MFSQRYVANTLARWLPKLNSSLSLDICTPVSALVPSIRICCGPVTKPLCDDSLDGFYVPVSCLLGDWSYTHRNKTGPRQRQQPYSSVSIDTIHYSNILKPIMHIYSGYPVPAHVGHDIPLPPRQSEGDIIPIFFAFSWKRSVGLIVRFCPLFGSKWGGRATHKFGLIAGNQDLRYQCTKCTISPVLLNRDSRAAGRFECVCSTPSFVGSTPPPFRPQKWTKADD